MSRLTELRTKDSWEALHGIRLIMLRYPNLEWLQSVWLELEKAVEGTEPKPATPKEITNWLSSYQRPCLTTPEHVWKFLKRHRNTIWKVAAIALTVSATIFWPEIRQFLGL